VKSVNSKIIVSVNPNQKDKLIVGGFEFQAANKYHTNYRYKSPTIAVVVEGNDFVKENDVLLCHHNLFYLPSPYHLTGDLFSIPFSKVLFAKILSNGDLIPICGNMICKEIPRETLLEMPPELKTFHKNRYEVIDGGWTIYKPKEIIFTRPSSGYEIVWNVNGVENKTIKVDSDMVCGVLK
jgi:hypothetical protein